jgi:RNA polymerase-binding transcription factor DksA
MTRAEAREATARTVLERERTRVQHEVDELRHGLGPFEQYGQHPSDLASDTLEQEVDRSLELALLTQLTEIDRALARLDTGQYGLCTACQQPISASRLDAVPWAERCVTHQAATERDDERVLDPAVPFTLLDESTESDDEDDHAELASEELALHMEYERTPHDDAT